jgi:hypothetical protein
MTYTSVARFEIASVVSRMSGVVVRNLRVFAALALTLSGLPSLAAGLFERGVLTPYGLEPMGPFGFAWIIGVLISTLLQAALIHGTISDLSGRPASLGDCLETAIRNVLPLIGIGILCTIATFVGLLLFIVPGVIWALALCVSAPVQVVEGHGVFDALGRSAGLTRGHRGAILLLFLLYAVGFGILKGLAETIPLATAIAYPGLADTVRALVVTPLLQSFGALIGAAGVASIYFELRTIKEGVGIEALARAFE